MSFPVSSIFAAGFVLIVICTVSSTSRQRQSFSMPQQRHRAIRTAAWFHFADWFQTGSLQEKTRGYGLMFRYGDCPFCIGGFDFPAGRDPYIRNTGHSYRIEKVSIKHPGRYSRLPTPKNNPGPGKKILSAGAGIRAILSLAPPEDSHAVHGNSVKKTQSARPRSAQITEVLSGSHSHPVP